MSPDSIKMVLLVTATAVVALLAAIAGYYVYQLRRLRQQQKRQLEALQEHGEEQRKRVNNSIRVIAIAAQNDELSLTEASIRLSVLLDSLGVEDSVRDEFSVFFQLRDATSHIPILDAWKQLTPRQQMTYDKERLEKEAQFREFVLDAAQRIQHRSF